MGCGTCKGCSVPTKTPLSQAIRSHGKARSYEPKALNERMLPMRKKKNLTISHTQHRTLPIPTPISLKRKNGNVRKKGDPHREQEKVNKGKNRRKVKRKPIR